MSLWNLIAHRRSQEILRKRYGVDCGPNCEDYRDLILYDFVLKCPDENAGFPPYSDNELDSQIQDESSVNCAALTATIISPGYGSQLCTGTISVDFVDPIEILEGQPGTPPSEESDTYELSVVGAAIQVLPPDTLLQVLIFKAIAPTTVLVGTTVGGDDIVFELPLAGGTTYSHTSNLYFEHGVTLYFSGTYNVKIATRRI